MYASHSSPARSGLWLLLVAVVACGDDATDAPDGGEPDSGERDAAAQRDELMMCCIDGSAECEDRFVLNNGDTTSPEFQGEGLVDTSVSRYNCGGCRQECARYPFPADDGLIAECIDGVCAPGGECFDDIEASVTCAELCATQNRGCVDEACLGITVQVTECSPSEQGPVLDIDCDAPIPEEHAGKTVFCCCDN